MAHSLDRRFGATKGLANEVTSWVSLKLLTQFLRSGVGRATREAGFKFGRPANERYPVGSGGPGDSRPISPRYARLGWRDDPAISAGRGDLGQKEDRQGATCIPMRLLSR